MDKAKIAARSSIEVTLEADKEYHWCQCGRSKNQPFCDGSHAGTGITPISFVVEEEQDAWLCRCKQTGSAPFCDGTHATLPKDVTELAVPDRSSDKDKEPAPKNTEEEPTLEYIHAMAKSGLKVVGRDGPVDAMGVPRERLPSWDDIQILTAQLDRTPRMDDAPVATELVIGPNANKPLRLKMPLLVSDMSFGALSEEAKLSLAKGAELAGTGIASGEGGMLKEAQQANSRYFYELASAQFGYEESLLAKVQAFHFKAGQAAKTGTGGHLPAAKVTERIAAVRHLPAGQDAISPAAFENLKTPADFANFAARVREVSGGIPIGFKMSAQHIEKDIDFALEAGADYIILDGRGGGTGAAPLLFRDHISVPTIPALARARRHLDRSERGDVTLIITGGLRTPPDFIKALCLGADGIALANSAMQAIGCIAARICHTNHCPSGVATQDPQLRTRLQVDVAAQRLQRFLTSSVALMQVMARACGHERLSDFCVDDLTTWKKDMAELSGVAYGGACKF
ncbi:glutamate synthase-related protein [Methylotuvimicrobium sp.]|uniref:glutamate synthase-related protein n=1 Tax=Methylotuvimicrobium sp. TaxID=2822413 RepID=UPI003D65EA36